MKEMDFSKSDLIWMVLKLRMRRFQVEPPTAKDISLFTSWTGYFLDGPVPALCGPFNRRDPVPRAPLSIRMKGSKGVKKQRSKRAGGGAMEPWSEGAREREKYSKRWGESHGQCACPLVSSERAKHEKREEGKRERKDARALRRQKRRRYQSRNVCRRCYALSTWD